MSLDYLPNRYAEDHMHTVFVPSAPHIINPAQPHRRQNGVEPTHSISCQVVGADKAGRVFQLAQTARVAQMGYDLYGEKELDFLLSPLAAVPAAAEVVGSPPTNTNRGRQTGAAGDGDRATPADDISPGAPRLFDIIAYEWPGGIEKLRRRQRRAAAMPHGPRSAIIVLLNFTDVISSGAPNDWEGSAEERVVSFIGHRTLLFHWPSCSRPALFSPHATFTNFPPPPTLPAKYLAPNTTLFQLRVRLAELW
jgi:hypothetical protein